jgi:hypothetical protein
MARTETLSSPSVDLIDGRPWRSADGMLAPALAAFCQRGLNVCLASRDAANDPIAAHGLACRQHGAALRVFMLQRGNDRILRAIEAEAPVAAIFSLPPMHRSIQLKAPRAKLATLLAEDVPELARQTAALRNELLAVGFSTAFASVFCAYDRHDVVAIIFVPEQAFVQTRGPIARSAPP